MIRFGRSMEIKMMKKFVYLLLAGLVSLMGCTVKYSFSGASISPEVKTVTIGYFNNMAPMVAPLLSPTLTDMLTQKIQRETRLEIQREGGQTSFEGEIIGYNSAPISISGDEYAQKNRLTVTVKVRFTNIKQPNLNYDKTFTAYEDYDTQQMLISIENQLIPIIVEKLVENIFNDAFSNW